MGEGAEPRGAQEEEPDALEEMIDAVAAHWLLPVLSIDRVAGLLGTTRNAIRLLGVVLYMRGLLVWV